MDFKKLFKNIYFIIGLCLAVLVVITASLTQVNKVFFLISCLLGGALCVDVGVWAVNKIVVMDSSDESELLPLTEQEKQYLKRSKRMKKVNNIMLAVLFFCSAIIFVVMGFRTM